MTDRSKDLASPPGPSRPSSLSPCSITIITLNEEKNLRACLESIRWAGEIILVDSGSTDATLAIAAEFGCKVFHNSWPGMREQKNFASDRAAGPWILNLDADEQLSPALQREVQAILANPAHDGYAFPRQNFFLGKWMRHGGWYPDATLRLFRKGAGRFGGVNPHSNVELPPGARVLQLREPLIHHTYTSLGQYVSKQFPYADAAAREIQARRQPAGVSGAWIFVKTCWKFCETYFLKRGFLDGTHGLIAAFGSTFGAWLKHSRLWELCREQERGPDQP